MDQPNKNINQLYCDIFNTTFGIGCKVSLKIGDGSIASYTVSEPAEVMNNDIAVCWFKELNIPVPIHYVCDSAMNWPSGSNKSDVYQWLLKNGFDKNPKKGSYATGDGHLNFDCIKRIHEIHLLLWHDDLKHFSIAVENISGKGNSGGGWYAFTAISLPKPIYTIEEAKALIDAISTK